MKKGITYLCKLVLVSRADTYDVKSAVCQCPAGLAGNCNHISALLYALEDFVRSGLRSGETCTDRLQQWNKPRAACVTPQRLHDVSHPKDTYGQEKRVCSKSRYDPRPANLRLQDPAEVSDCTRDLQEVHDQMAASDSTGNVHKY